jgi:hypothetical protein
VGSSVHASVLEDIVISNVDPIADIAQHETALSHVIQDGDLVIDRSSR